MVVFQLAGCLLLSVLFVQSSGQVTAEQMLVRGLMLEEIGEYEQALEMWEQVHSKLDGPSTAIGAEYIRLVTEHSLTTYYPVAVNMYMWGLSEGAESGWNRPAFQEEMKRLEPILNEEEFRNWERMFEDEETVLPGLIRTFWDLQNPLPGRQTNVRLLEHWMRIAYARSEFTRRVDPPYGTDARGRYYVQYGEPVTRDTGKFHVNRQDVENVTSKFFGEGIFQQEGGTNPFSSGRLNGGPSSDDFKTGLKSALIMGAAMIDMEYEIWRYERMNEYMPYGLVLLFGTPASGTYGRLETVEEMIPLNLFSVSHMSVFNPHPDFATGFILQWLFYEQLAYKDPYFGNLFNNLVASSTLYGASPPKRIAMDLKLENQIRTRQYYVDAPVEFSTEEKKLPEIPVEIYQYRMLDEEDEPILLSFVESRPTAAFLYDLAAYQQEVPELRVNQQQGDRSLATREPATPEQYRDELEGELAGSDNQIDEVTGDTLIDAPSEERLENYGLTHGLRLGDEQGNLFAQSRFQTTMIIDVEEDSPSWSVFAVPYLSEGSQQIFFAEMANHDQQSTSRVESLFPAEIRGRGRVEVPQPQPLSESGEGFLQSDLILGFQKEADPPAGTLIPFVVSNDRLIPENENLVIHFETYRLQPDESGIASFEVSYEIRTVGRFLFWDRVNREQEYSITLFFQSDSSRFSETLEIESRELEPGSYEIQWNITDLNSGKTSGQNVRFEIVGR